MIPLLLQNWCPLRGHRENAEDPGWKERRNTPFPTGLCGGSVTTCFCLHPPPSPAYITNPVSQQLKTVPENRPTTQCNVIYTVDLQHLVTLTGYENSACTVQNLAVVMPGTVFKGALRLGKRDLTSREKLKYSEAVHSQTRYLKNSEKKAFTKWLAITPQMELLISFFFFFF